jgi:hypothetical protein
MQQTTIQAVQSALIVLAAYLQIWVSKLAKAVVPGTTVSLLSNPSKMPGKAFGLPAHKACPRAKGSICDSCYAAKGCYSWKSSKHAQQVRFEWTRDCMRTDEGVALWVATMVQALVGETYFRIHDSGDFFNPRYAKAWLQVCKALPATKFWAPTRAWQGGVMGPLPVFDPLLNTLRELAALPNVTVRPSALDFGDLAPVVSGLHAGSTADMSDESKAYQCPAKRLYDGHCGPCRTCWDAKSVAVNYPKH